MNERMYYTILTVNCVDKRVVPYSYRGSTRNRGGSEFYIYKFGIRREKKYFKMISVLLPQFAP